MARSRQQETRRIRQRAELLPVVSVDLRAAQWCVPAALSIAAKRRTARARRAGQRREDVVSGPERSHRRRGDADARRARSSSSCSRTRWPPTVAARPSPSLRRSPAAASVRSPRSRIPATSPRRLAPDGTSIVLTGPYYKADAPLCCPTKSEGTRDPALFERLSGPRRRTTSRIE